MNKLTFSLLLSLGLLSGCAHQYVMKLSNGHEVTTKGKPKLVGGNYHFKDALGRDNVISQGRVTVIEPASFAREEQKPAPISKPKKERHWYFLWLA